MRNFGFGMQRQEEPPDNKLDALTKEVSALLMSKLLREGFADYDELIELVRPIVVALQLCRTEMAYDVVATGLVDTLVHEGCAEHVGRKLWITPRGIDAARKLEQRNRAS